MKWLIIDTTIRRVYLCVAGALKTNGGQTSQALGLSRGGFVTTCSAYAYLDHNFAKLRRRFVAEIP